MSLRILLLGYGKMGKAVEAEAEKRGHTIAGKIDVGNKDHLSEYNNSNVDVVIEFTHPETAMENFRRLLTAGLPVVTGTTGWLDQLEEVRNMTQESNGAFVYASNFSPGVNILFKLNERLAELMNKFGDYDPLVEEKHHSGKKDAPSGTALSLTKGILEGLDRKNKIVHTDLVDRAPEADELSVGWTRAGAIIGEHTVGYSSDIDEIRIEHRAYNRRGFALGAVLAAEWIVNQRGFYNFSEIFEEV